MIGDWDFGSNLGLSSGRSSSGRLCSGASCLCGSSLGGSGGCLGSNGSGVLGDGVGGRGDLCCCAYSSNLLGCSSCGRSGCGRLSGSRCLLSLKRSTLRSDARFLLLQERVLLLELEAQTAHLLSRLGKLVLYIRDN